MQKTLGRHRPWLVFTVIATRGRPGVVGAVAVPALLVPGLPIWLAVSCTRGVAAEVAVPAGAWPPNPLVSPPGSSE
jgi:hypothetical protein